MFIRKTCLKSVFMGFKIIFHLWSLSLVTNIILSNDFRNVFFHFIGPFENFYAKSKNWYRLLKYCFYFKTLVKVFKIITWGRLWTVGFIITALPMSISYWDSDKDLYYVLLWYEKGCLKIDEVVTCHHLIFLSQNLLEYAF